MEGWWFQKHLGAAGCQRDGGRKVPSKTPKFQLWNITYRMKPLTVTVNKMGRWESGKKPHGELNLWPHVQV